ncbi:hypothetical protein LCGC14_0383010 [marine sediment metagenome]|uniref:Uncharacterized protein n=1 Tax=marine sediment metagenome TaxID=412755 RepID=A0A0F9TJQ7_9ZZZZ
MPRKESRTLKFDVLSTPSENSLAKIESNSTNLVDISDASNDKLKELKYIRRANEIIIGQEVEII